MRRLDSSWRDWPAIWARELDSPANKSTAGAPWRNCAASNSSALPVPRKGEVIFFELSKERDGQVIARNFSADRHSKRPPGWAQFRGKVLEGLVHIHTYAGHRHVPPIAVDSAFDQDAGDLAPRRVDVVWRFDGSGAASPFYDRRGGRAGEEGSQLRRFVQRDPGPEHDREQQALEWPGFPAPAILAAAGRLPFGKHDEPFRRAPRVGFPGQVIRGARFVHHHEFVSHQAGAEGRPQFVGHQPVRTITARHASIPETCPSRARNG